MKEREPRKNEREMNDWEEGKELVGGDLGHCAAILFLHFQQ
jgi:hypothetical protein